MTPVIEFQSSVYGTTATYGGEKWTFSPITRTVARVGGGVVRERADNHCTPEGELTRAVLDALDSLRVPTLASRVYHACERIDFRLRADVIRRLAPRYFSRPAFPAPGYLEFDRHCRALDTVYGLPAAPGDVGALARQAASDLRALPILADACDDANWTCGPAIRDLWTLLGRPV